MEADTIGVEWEACCGTPESLGLQGNLPAMSFTRGSEAHWDEVSSTAKVFLTVVPPSTDAGAEE